MSPQQFSSIQSAFPPLPHTTLLSPLSFSLSLILPCATSYTQSTAGPPSLWPVSVLFHLACCYRGLDAGRLQLGSQSFSIYQKPPSVQSQPHSLPSPTSTRRQCNSSPLSTPPPSRFLLPSKSSSFDQSRNLAHKPPDKKKGRKEK